MPPKGLEAWKQQCGLLWVLSPRAGDPIRIRITGKGGETLDCGQGFPVDGHRLGTWTLTEVPPFEALAVLPAGP